LFVRTLLRLIPLRGTQPRSNPEGIASFSPRLARWRLPWVTGNQIINRNAVAAKVAQPTGTEWTQPTLIVERMSVRFT